MTFEIFFIVVNFDWWVQSYSRHRPFPLQDVGEELHNYEEGGKRLPAAGFRLPDLRSQSSFMVGWRRESCELLASSLPAADRLLASRLTITVFAYDYGALVGGFE